MNLSLTAVTAVMAAWRLGEEEAGPGYLALGLAGIGAMGYSAYLGGKMVYEHGVGVKPADGLRDGDSPELAPGHLGEAAARAAADLKASIPATIADLKAGNLAPSLGQDLENPERLAPTGRPVTGSGAAAAAAPEPGRRPRVDPLRPTPLGRAAAGWPARRSPAVARRGRP
jgi:hypothetical protein